jgi:hypothetical protein
VHLAGNVLLLLAAARHDLEPEVLVRSAYLKGRLTIATARENEAKGIM